jgi:glycosyltransferase involved in cell wall biosynthesis
MDSRTPEISVVIPARDAAGTLLDTLDGLADQSAAPPFEVIVVDDGSVDETHSMAERHAVVDRVVALAGEGPAAARNAGAELAGADQLAFLDADCRPTAGWLAAGGQALVHCDLALGQTEPRPDQPLGPFDRSLWVSAGSPLFESANLFVRRELFWRLGGFQSWLGPATGKELGEDVWFGWRARRCGARIAAAPSALAHHVVERRGGLAFVNERWRLRFFPALVRRIPELRTELMFARVFLTRRSAYFDAAAVGLLCAWLTRRPAVAAAAAPYAGLLIGDLRGPWGKQKALIYPVADAVGCSALVLGSLRYGSLLV